VVAKQKFRYWL